MRLALFILLAVSLLPADLPDVFSDDGEKQGRRGNALYDRQEYQAAAEAFAEGLAALDEGAEPALRYALENNLGAALLKAGDVKGAREAFGRALDAASAAPDTARTAYNAGNAAFAESDFSAAVDLYRYSLLQDPTNVDAKFNYELARRQLEQQQQQQQQQEGSNRQEQDRQQPDQQQNGGNESEQDEGEQQEQEQQQQQQNGGQDQQQGAEPEQTEERQESSSGAQENPVDLSEEQAERILQALQNEEEQLLREVQRPKSRARPVEKDW